MRARTVRSTVASGRPGYGTADSSRDGVRVAIFQKPATLPAVSRSSKTPMGVWL